jgi:hypothetical protein
VSSPPTTSTAIHKDLDSLADILALVYSTTKAQKEVRQLKHSVYKSCIDCYTRDSKDDRYEVLWKDLHSPAVRNYTLNIRLIRANQGKEAANKSVISPIGVM